MSVQAVPIRVLATRWCVDCRIARRVLDKSGAAYTWIDIDKDREGQAEVLRVNRGMRSVPTIIFGDGSVMVEPSRRALTEKLSALMATVNGTAAPVVGAGDSCGADGLPSCDTGPLGRFGFVARELKDILGRRRPPRT